MRKFKLLYLAFILTFGVGNVLSQNVVDVEDRLYMVKCVEGGMYWDFTGYHLNAHKKNATLKIWTKDHSIENNQGFDRVYRFVKKSDNSYSIYPQHVKTDLIPENYKAEVGKKVKIGKYAGRGYYNLIKVKNRKNTYYIKDKRSGLYLEIPKEKAKVKRTQIVFANYTGKTNQMFYLEEFNRKNAAPPKTGYNIIKNTNKMLGVGGTYPSVGNSDKLKLTSYSIDPNRIFEIKKRGNYYTIRLDNLPNKYLTINADKSISLRSATNKDNQLFSFEMGDTYGHYLIKNKSTGFYLRKRTSNELYALYKRGKKNYSILTVSKYFDAKHHFNTPSVFDWEIKPHKRMKPLYAGTYYVKTLKGSKYWDIPGKGGETNKNGKDVQIWSMDSGSDRKVKFVPIDDGKYYYVEFQNGGRVLDIRGVWNWNSTQRALNKVGKAPKRKKDKGADVQLWRKTGSSVQKWIISYVNNKGFQFKSSHVPYHCVDIRGGKFSNGTDLIMWKNKKSDNQIFKIIDTKTKKEIKY